MEELHADVQRQIRVKQNAALIEARDKEEAETMRRFQEGMRSELVGAPSKPDTTVTQSHESQRTQQVKEASLKGAASSASTNPWVNAKNAPETEAWAPQLRKRDQEGYTFTVKSPELGSGSDQEEGGGGEGVREGEAVDRWGVGIVTRTNSSSPAESVLALPAGVASIHAESIHDLNLGHSAIFPIMPEFFQRYDRKTFSKKEETAMMIESFTLDFRPGPDPPGWKPIVHPEGILYFYNEEKSAVTEANLYNHLYLEKITSDIATLEDFIRSRNLKMPEDYTLAMDLTMPLEGASYTDYYYADHDKKIVFFLDDVAAESNLPVWSQLKGVTSIAHLKHEVEAQYWYHGVLYPCTIKLAPEHVFELRDIILHYLGDIMTSHYSTSPYTPSELNTMLSQVNNLRKNLDHTSSPGAVNLLTRQKFLNWHGVPEARIYRDQSVYGERTHKTLLIKTLSPLLFSAPDVHLKSLEKLWVDGLMHGPVWREAIGKLNDEWQEFTLYATVLLNANVAYLAIQSIDTVAAGYRSPIQVENSWDNGRSGEW
ncbi:hypothetical protein EST38_g3803 [Candolleomyces aberdarensis]|uniref:Uncharacterized protein n=1 Tax=Candolleomyces aberdarensis TaxID=2316362 RepID=A0A4Q2DPG2_9AGAR|nr:hypothetical protein EST38_g3803 [Candolleomyces aberdarensis]